ncbi:MAG: trypsin-like serine protease [Rhizobiaceae bacterium]|nr:trypsin-like serine protease [Rhizobiaceae bacterium]
MMARMALALAATALLAAGASAAERLDPRSKFADRAVGATERLLPFHEVAEGRYPFQVALLNGFMLADPAIPQAEAQFCGGTLIAPDWVLTAARCVAYEGEVATLDSTLVLAGSVDLNKGRRVAVAEIIVHEDFDWESDAANVALLRLATPVTDLAPVRLADGPGAELSGKAHYLGWGLLDDGTWPTTLQETETVLVPSDVCGEGMFAAALRQVEASLQDAGFPDDAVDSVMTTLGEDGAKPLAAGQLCTGNDALSAPALGNDGGPLLVDTGAGLVQVGVIAAGSFPPLPYATHADVGYLRGWIRDKTGI